MKIPDRYWQGQTLLEARLPWLTPGAIEALERFVKATHHVLEFGAGGSTLYFADHCASVTTWESEPVWRERILALLGNAAGKCQMLSRLEMAMASPNGFPSGVAYDIVLVDNSDSQVNRAVVNPTALRLVGPAGWFILDNYARYRLKFLDGWQTKKYDDAHWDGKGTLIATNPRNSFSVTSEQQRRKAAA